MLVAALFLSHDVFDRVEPFDIGDPDSEVVGAQHAFEDVTGRSAEPEVVLLVDSKAGGSSTTSSRASRRLRAVPGIARVMGPDSNPVLVSEDRTEELILGYLDAGAGRVEVGDAVDAAFASTPGVLTGGTAVAASQVGAQSERDTRVIELYAAPVLLLLLLLVFRTVVAAVLPLVVATFSILLTFATLRFITEVSTVDLFALQTVTGLGTGLAIDYSLFILARFREEIGEGSSYRTAHLNTLRTAGRTVTFSSITVATALISLTVFPQPFLYSTGIAGALTAIFAGLTALLVLPAILAIFGPSVNRFAVRRHRPHRPAAAGFWQRLPRAVCRRPVSAVLVSGVVMLAFASQAIGIDVRTPDASELPSTASSRVVADSIEDFPLAPQTFLYALLPGTPDETKHVAGDVERIEDVEATSRPRSLDDDTSLLYVTASMDPLSKRGQDLVSDVRANLPSGSLLGGRAAEQVDQRSSILDHAPLAIAIVVLTNLLILVGMTRSLLLPLFAVTINLLTVAASVGALVLAFTTDWIAGLLGADVQNGIDMSVPVIVFAIGFGLSTDYGIFLFARIREERAKMGEEDAIIAGVASTGSLISASALLLAVAVGAFVFSDLVIVKEFAVAIAFAVLLDATVVRGLLIPGLLRLLGRRAWRLPWSLGASPRAEAVDSIR
jgi:uncharacterized membrane protein YdfJ with MMPL/SSD domain